jgi:hypothetical protein
MIFSNNKLCGTSYTILKELNSMINAVRFSKMFCWNFVSIALLVHLCTFLPISADVQVRFGASLCADECEYMSNRRVKTHKACEHFLNKKLYQKHAPKIALCFSGGGMRAAILSLGCLKAAQDTGLLACCTYVASLSGSTWSVAGATALTGACDNQTTALSDYCSQVRENINIQSIDALMTQERAQELWDYLKQRSVPLPIYTAIEASSATYRWVEFTPFEMGIAEDVNAHIPMNGFGNDFVQGVGTGYEKTLGYCLATFGSAFAVNMHDIILHMSNSLLSKISMPAIMKCAVRSLLDMAINKIYESYEDSSFAAFTKQHLMAAHVPNYCHGISENPLSDLATLTLVDAGIAFNNLPLVPLLNPERHVDVIIVYDSSEHVHDSPALAAIEWYAHEHEIPFPAIDYTGIEKRPISVFEGDDVKTPTIIYIPRFTTDVSIRTVDPKTCLADGSCSTFRFRYTPEEFDALCDISYSAFKKQVPVFKRAIHDKVALASV